MKIDSDCISVITLVTPGVPSGPALVPAPVWCSLGAALSTAMMLRVVKSSEEQERTSDLSVERLELGHVLMGAAVHQVGRWVQQWDSLQLAGRSSSGHLRVSTPACNSEEKWETGAMGKTAVDE